MKRIITIFVLFCTLASCGSNKPSPEQKELSEQYIEGLVDAGINIYGGELTDANILVLAIDAMPGANFDIFAKTYLEDALNNGLNVKGVAIVDINDCQIGDGWVTGDRIGRAYK